MTGAWAALLGAVVGGVLTLAGTLTVEVRRDRRRQIGAARLIVSELDRAIVELNVLTDDSPEPGRASWKEGPHRGIGTTTWERRAADFVGSLDSATFELVDRAHSALGQAGEFGFTQKEGLGLIEVASSARSVIAPLGRPTWLDRHVWRL
jgi:hypothetical protein